MQTFYACDFLKPQLDFQLLFNFIWFNMEICFNTEIKKFLHLFNQSLYDEMMIEYRAPVYELPKKTKRTFSTYFWHRFLLMEVMDDTIPFRK